ncbi:sugar phosphate nucleotidyltransferase [Bacillus sp. V5-8f]|uniref:sugar phosphate nucleotidyltransferase n=1 Tax=Bacillus sp. V5-8f TaxID=2053044 RepID=UPI000C777B2F|nr:sugar phosphate nucleotidyltransferase [Bacillus sp. V5-8f]PLT35487.1 mannose-1-phosphate guanylyltransferase [Bacillus sp. V5-8f]
MKIILLSGGSGTRLWPLSNSVRSKQYLKLLQSSSGYESMIQRIWRQLSDIGLVKHTYLSTNKEQVDSIYNQLGNDVRLIIEPERRDTFPAIALAAAYLQSVEGIENNEVICVLPVDQLVDNQFFSVLKQLEQIHVRNNAEISLLGLAPTKPSEKYGYIIPDHTNDQSCQKVKHFIEKPSKDLAERLIQSKALWNCGVFAFKLQFLIDLLKNKDYPTDYMDLVSNYAQLPKISFDFEVLEKAQNVIVMPFDGYWKDLGTWGEFTQVMETNIKGRGILSDDSSNVHIINELNIPIVINGLSDVVLAASQDGILISHKDKSSAIKTLVNHINERQMVEERRWGSYRVLDFLTLEDGNKVLTKSISIHSGKNLSYQTHAKRSEVWTIIWGTGLFVLNERIRKVKPGDVLEIPIGAKHAVKALTDLQFIEVQMGSELLEDDIERICMTWEDIEKLSWKNEHFPYESP